FQLHARDAVRTTRAEGRVSAELGAPWIIVPAYQAASTLGTVLARIGTALHAVGARVLVVDDGSTDATAEVARRGGAEVLRNDRNLGYARTQKRGWRHALERG